MIRKFSQFKLTEASVYPMIEYVDSHVSSWFSAKYMKVLEDLLMKSFGVKLERKNGYLIVSEELSHICQERGVEILEDLDGLLISARHIYMSGIPWIQIVGSSWTRMSNDEFGKPVYSLRMGNLGSLANVIDRNDTSSIVIKNLEDLQKIKVKALELYRNIDKKGYSKEINQIAKDLKFKPVWDTDVIHKIALQIINSLNIAAVIQKERNSE